MPKYKVVTNKGQEVGGITVHSHALGKSESLKPDDKGFYDMDRSQARIVAQGHIVRALDGSGLIDGTKAITLYDPKAVLKNEIPAPVPVATKESLMAKKPEDLRKTAEALAIDLPAEAKKQGKKGVDDFTPDEIADMILARLDMFERAKEKMGPQGAAQLSSYSQK